MQRYVVYEEKSFRVHHLVVYKDYPHRPSLQGPHDAKPLPIAPNEVVHKQ